MHIFAHILGNNDGQLHFHAARGIEQQFIDTPELHISRGLVDRVATERQPLLTSDAWQPAIAIHRAQANHVEI